VLTGQHAVVCYIAGELAEFVSGLRRELAPRQGHLRTHITLLPPRLLQLNESEALAHAKEACRATAPFTITAGGVQDFLPINPVLYLDIERGAKQLCQLHDALHHGPLHVPEPWPFVPHLTLASLTSPGQTRSSQELVKRRWKAYRGPRAFTVSELELVREEPGERWADLGSICLAG